MNQFLTTKYIRDSRIFQKVASRALIKTVKIKNSKDVNNLDKMMILCKDGYANYFCTIPIAAATVVADALLLYLWSRVRSAAALAFFTLYVASHG